MIKKLLSLHLPHALALLACASLAAAADSEKPAKGGAKTTDAAAAKDAKKSGGAPQPAKKGAQQQAEEKSADTAEGLGAFGKILPLGQKNLDAKMPSFRDGKPSSFVHAGEMTRVDENHMDLVKVDIRMYGATQKDDLRVQLLTGAYDMNSQVLDSRERSRVSRSDFQLEGDSMVFDTRSQQGKMVGHVHMIIYDADSVKKGPLGAPAQGASGSAPEATPSKAAPATEKPAKVKK